MMIPSKISSIHLIAVCGTAMGAVAAMLKDTGFDVTGSDSGVYPPMSDFLASKGIDIKDGFSADNLAHKPDLVIVGNAVRRDNPEAQEMFRSGLNYCSMPQAINHFLVNGKKALVVTGTHGKTTTSSLLSWILYEAGLDPSFMIGGILKNFNSNYRIGNGDYVVLEGDEYDTAFFDKGSKFLHYNPFMAILTGIEFDHADIFKDLAHVRTVFGRFISGMSEQSTLFAYDKTPPPAPPRNGEGSFLYRCHLIKYGKQQDSTWQLSSFSPQPPITNFEIVKSGKLFGKFRTKLIGEHNLLNAAAAIGVADAIGISSDIIVRALESFDGVKRRQEVRGEVRGITVMDDFAHHPTAVKETIRAVKPFYPDGRLIAVFEPRTNTSMRQVFQNVYPLCFDDADLICIRKPSRLDKVPESERFSSEKLVEDLNAQGKTAYHFSDTESVIAFLSEHAESGDVILIMSNGGFDNIHDRFLIHPAASSDMFQKKAALH